MMKPFATAPLEQENESLTIVFLMPDDVLKKAFGILAIWAKRISGQSVCKKD